MFKTLGSQAVVLKLRITNLRTYYNITLKIYSIKAKALDKHNWPSQDE